MRKLYFFRQIYAGEKVHLIFALPITERRAKQKPLQHFEISYLVSCYQLVKQMYVTVLPTFAKIHF
jgi:hypothetical protein